MTVGAALYCVANDGFMPIYDFPTPKKGRTNGVNKIHWFEVEFD